VTVEPAASAAVARSGVDALASVGTPDAVSAKRSAAVALCSMNSTRRRTPPRSSALAVCVMPPTAAVRLPNVGSVNVAMGFDVKRSTRS
jgi:hypothetical protein